MTSQTSDLFGWTPAQGDLSGDATPVRTALQVGSE
jgi:hypothetical protein